MKEQRKDSSGGRNQGEGDKESARRYNEAQQAFVHSSRGQDAIEDAGDLSEAEAREGERAEAAGRAARIRRSTATRARTPIAEQPSCCWCRAIRAGVTIGRRCVTCR